MSASSGAGGSRIRDLFRRASNAGSLGSVVFRGIGGILLAIGTAIASGILTIADLVIVPGQALLNGVGDILSAVFGGSAQIINLGALGTAQSIGPGGQFNLGPFTFALGIGSVLLGLFVINRFLSEPETGNIAPGLPFDIPTPGFQGPEEDNEES